MNRVSHKKAVLQELDAYYAVAPETYVDGVACFLEIDEAQILPSTYSNESPIRPRGCFYGISNAFDANQARLTEQRVLVKLWENRHGVLPQQLVPLMCLTPIEELTANLWPLEEFDQEPAYEGVTRVMFLSWIAEHYTRTTGIAVERRKTDAFPH